MTPSGTGYLYDERFLQHDTGQAEILLPAGGALEPVEHPSAARITRRTHALIAGSGLYDQLVLLPAQYATEDDLALYHTREHIRHVRTLCEAGGGQASVDPAESAPVSAESFDAALLAAGSGMAVVDAVLEGQVRNALALIRPPGHHAMAGEAMGFCLFNNVVIAARHAQRAYGTRRIMIVDWDVHHGNGTQAAFYHDPDVLFVSLHQDDWYPAGWGKVDDIGTDGAAGRTVNIPLPAGTGDRGYLEAFERVVRPVAGQFLPELILISAGQDPGMMDPLGRMMVTMDGFRDLATVMREVAEEVCGGHLVALQEGGYSAAYAPFCVHGALEGLMGQRSAVEDPNRGTPELNSARTEYRSLHARAIDRVIEVQHVYWDL